MNAMLPDAAQSCQRLALRFTHPLNLRPVSGKAEIERRVGLTDYDAVDPELT
jgi:hypothetical protein